MLSAFICVAGACCDSTDDFDGGASHSLPLNCK